MAMAQGPKGINFTYAQTEKALDDQLRWIDQLDGKAGICWVPKVLLPV